MRWTALALLPAVCLMTGCKKSPGGPGPALVAETYTLKLKETGPGDVTEVTGSSVTRARVKVAGPGGRALKDEARSESDSFSYRDTVVERPEGAATPTKLRRKYDNAVVV